MLTALGLDAVAESVYRAMLAHPGDGVAALAARLSLAEPQVRNALDHLSELALLRPSADRPGSLRAVSPDVGMEILMARQQAELAAAQARIEASRAAAAQLIADYADLRPEVNTPDVEQLVGLDRIRDRLSRFSREAREEIMTFAPEGGQKPEHIEAAKPLDRTLLERGVRMRTIYLDSVRNSPHTVEYVNWLAALGGRVSTVPELPTRMIIVDRAAAVIPVRSDDTAAGAVVLTGQGMLTVLCALFESVWAGAQPLGATAPLDQDGLTAQERTALTLLADGHTDDAIAKRLGVSPRTARRIATDLMERLEARSRFQAGARAAQAGWLS
ncbi:LuxR C-terminal-related transcriptional regulator [Kitasatospora purpeofusca]|uniref:LuxR C-terminal-related transcriptional regulator n=1 Tax=Kitasatospora purpeofusca TaxID=67352 RepID=UPI00225252D9|nr:LuxR C-terminal-related transcriptional regulator [Kitasatospora purpeofusca]MCX4754424.1 LuxR C-terminal-related transcriptional regulator [Kitasatospora purpeofusca]WSR33846.1 LuxR C-terminal-related transcriptional regulator [Kitasatospora purpeofusca]WSR42062.1 LuxR C-terminal-related transcriptional regulator [Kitasatospora purpeofusca]